LDPKMLMSTTPGLKNAGCPQAGLRECLTRVGHHGEEPRSTRGTYGALQQPTSICGSGHPGKAASGTPSWVLESRVAGRSGRMRATIHLWVVRLAGGVGAAARGENGSPSHPTTAVARRALGAASCVEASPHQRMPRWRGNAHECAQCVDRDATGLGLMGADIPTTDGDQPVFKLNGISRKGNGNRGRCSSDVKPGADDAHVAVPCRTPL
jgi:hypothetical protein